MILSFSRTRGGDPQQLGGATVFGSFFPHTRGWSCSTLAACSLTRVFPAHAGVILVSCSVCKLSTSFSRTRGGDPQVELRWNQSNWFFPHTRGWSRGSGLGCEYNFVFPAHAGVILQHSSRLFPDTSFSRTRGGDPANVESDNVTLWFFPHTRGWSQPELLDLMAKEVFPAHAGVIPPLPAPAQSEFGFSRTRGGDPVIV